jgi:hypothetical protein
MPYSTDSDLLKYQPYAFEHGVASFAAFHTDAEADINRDIQALWLPTQSQITVPSRPSVTDGTEEGAFDATKLKQTQWMKASVYKVLAGYVLPSLAASIGGEGFVTMISFYAQLYKDELQRVFAGGVQYHNGTTYTIIYGTLNQPPPRLQR